MKNSKVLVVKADGSYSYHSVLKEYSRKITSGNVAWSFQSVSDTIEQRKGKSVRMIAYFYDEQPCRRDGAATQFLH
jgi:hypothetical protein